MKIVVVGTRGFPGVQGGVENHCEHLYSSLSKLGCEVVVFTRRPYVGGETKKIGNILLMPVSCSQNKYFEAFTHSFLSVLKARKMRPNIIHIHAIGPSLTVPLARILGFRVVMTNHGFDYERKKWGALGRIVLRLGECLGSKYANAIICISKNIADYIRNKYHREVYIIPNGVVIPEITDSKGILEKHNLTVGKYILSVGRFVPEKGFHDLIAAFNKSGLSGWKLVIVGRADHEDEYSKYIKQSALANSDIVLPGFLSGLSLKEVYSYAGMFVLPSYHEGLPIVLLEALSYGLSCIVSDIPSNREIGLSYDRYFNAGDTDAMAKKITKYTSALYTYEEKAGQINRLKERYDWDAIAGQTLSVYKHVLSKK